ncbi:hypothetical protein [Mucilaginibacter flavidus]|uniref:hypothetical protein n=1 Tax=Mucilaginibacter flavidus TaxID=2949309 RepID=UPI0020936405|nr:hypothetical protein [Mucilaginibacter flavidus]MCO5949935.1 hypothetical protein [Mucilaginibacter flavidus]
MIKLSLTIFFLFGLVFCYGQANHQLDKDTTRFKNAPLYILQLPLADPLEASGIIIKPDNIESINVFKDGANTKEYGKKAINGLIIIKTKKTLKLLSINQLLTLNHIKNNGLPLFIDSAIANMPGTYYFEKEMVKSVKVETEKETGMKYINIATLFPVHRLKSDEIYIK